MGDAPIKVFKVGGISFSCWQNDDGVSIKFDGRTFKDKEGNWQQTNYLNRSDIAKLKVAVDELFQWAFKENIFKGKFKEETDFQTAAEMVK